MHSLATTVLARLLCWLAYDAQASENDLFNIKIQNEINVAPMRSYIEEWLESQLNQAADERQHAVSTIPAVVDNINEKTSANK